MANINLKLNFVSTLGLIFFILLFIVILMRETIFDLVIMNTGGNEIEESRRTTAATADLLLSLNKISFDTKVLNSTYLQSLTPLPNFPIDSQSLFNFGKANPFIGNFIVVTPTSGDSTGGVVYSSQQRALNNNQPIRAVPNNRR